MTMLKDLVRRSAWRSRAAGEVEIAPQVFEVTDLFIPAGTDWSAGHEIGAVEQVTGQLCVATAFLSVAAVGAALSLEWREETSPVLGTFSPMTGRYWSTDSFYGLIGDNDPSGAAPAPESLRWSAVLVTPGPTPAPITIVRATATLLVG